MDEKKSPESVMGVQMNVNSKKAENKCNPQSKRINSKKQKSHKHTHTHTQTDRQTHSLSPIHSTHITLSDLGV